MSDEGTNAIVDHDNLHVFRNGIHPVSHRVLAFLSSRDDPGDLAITVFLDNLLETETQVVLTDDKDDVVHQGTTFKSVEGMRKNGFPCQREKLLLFPLMKRWPFPAETMTALTFAIKDYVLDFEFFARRMRMQIKRRSKKHLRDSDA